MPPCSGVYPRLRGGTCTAVPSRLATMGLSPLARGNQHPGVLGVPLQGSIPACAGEPILTERGDRYGRVYPRLRGGTRDVFDEDEGLRGLSPLARGNLSHRAVGHALAGSIPACAGEPSRRP